MTESILAEGESILRGQDTKTNQETLGEDDKG